MRPAMTDTYLIRNLCAQCDLDALQAIGDEKAQRFVEDIEVENLFEARSSLEGISDGAVR